MIRSVIASSLTIVLYAGLPAAAGAAESVYTDIVLGKCKAIVEPNPDEPGGDFIITLCPGLKDYKVLFKEGDLRQSLHYGFLSRAIVDDAWASFGHFNYMNPKIEWRVDDTGVPYAAIQRFFIGEAHNLGQVLRVSRVGQPDDEQGCPVGYVDALANKNANDLAREVADTLAASFQCGKDAAVYHGTRGPKAGDIADFTGMQ